MLTVGSCKLYKIAENKAEYKRMIRTLSNENTGININPGQVNETLMDNFIKELDGVEELHLIHDPSDIRKPYSEKTENLGKVRDLKSNIINGYSSHNIVAILPKDRSVHLISHETYSNKDPNFLKAETVTKIQEDKDFDNKADALELYNSGNYFNKKTLTKDILQASSKPIKEYNPDIKIHHILDREFDDNDYFDFIKNELKDYFTIRAKKSRTIPKDKNSKEKAEKLIDHEFANSHQINVEKFQHKNKVYQNVVIDIRWDEYNGDQAVIVTIKNRNGKDVFKDPMLLITNAPVNDKDEAYKIYIGYLKRSKIEYVFRFLKDGLGWEEMQVGNFEAIKNLLSLCFYVSSYLYDIGEEMAYDDYAIVLADLGGGKGKVTRYYIYEGIKCLMSKVRADRIFKKYKVSQETVDKMASMFET